VRQPLFLELFQNFNDENHNEEELIDKLIDSIIKASDLDEKDD